MTDLPPDDAAWSAITRHFAGQLSEREEVELRRRLIEDPQWQQVFEELSEIWKHAESPRQAWDARAALERIKAARSARVVPLRPHSGRGVVRITVAARGFRASRWWQRMGVPLRVAAALLVAIGVGSLVWKTTAHEPVQMAVKPAPLHSVTTKRGEQAALQLADGTRIILGAGSTLRYAPGIDDAPTRDVYLDGEAYFEVTHDAAKPFAVHTARAIAHDLGTKFVVRAYPDAKYVEVVVADGAVSLRPARGSTIAPSAGPAHRGTSAPPPDSLIMTRADLGRVDASGRVSAVHGVDVDTQLAWTHGELAFADVPLRDVLPRLNRWYDIDVRLGDSTLAGYQFSASFTTEPAAQALQVLAAALKLRVERRGEMIVLYRGARQ